MNKSRAWVGVAVALIVASAVLVTVPSARAVLDVGPTISASASPTEPTNGEAVTLSADVTSMGKIVSGTTSWCSSVTLTFYVTNAANSHLEVTSDTYDSNGTYTTSWDYESGYLRFFVVGSSCGGVEGSNNASLFPFGVTTNSPAPGPTGSPPIVGATGSATTTSSTVSVTLSVASGSGVFVLFTYSYSATISPSVTDTDSDSYTVHQNPDGPNAAPGLSWIAWTPGPTTSGSLTVTVHYGSSPGNGAGMTAIEIQPPSGATGVGLDAYGYGGATSGLTSTSAPATFADSSDLLLAALILGSGSTSPSVSTSGVTYTGPVKPTTQPASYALYTWYGDSPSSGLNTASFTWTGTNGAGAWAVGFYGIGTGSPLSVDAGVTVTVKGATTYGVASETYTWQAAGSSIGSAAWLNYSSSTVGAHTLYLNVTDASGATARAIAQVDVIADPTVSFTAVHNPSDAGYSVTFTADPVGGTAPFNYTWTDNGVTAGWGSPWDYTFASSGSFTIGLALVDAEGETASSSTTETVNADLTVSASANVTATDTGLPIKFTASPTGGSSPITYAWDLNGTEEVTSGTPASYTFLDGGTYSMKLVGTDAVGSTSSSTISGIQVSNRPSLQYSGGSENEDQGTSEPFTEQVVGGTAAYSWTWKVNGVTEQTASGTSNTYTLTVGAPGNYWVNVTVMDAVGMKAKTSWEVTSHADPTVTFSSVENPSDAGYSVTFTATPTGGISPYNYTWTINSVTSGYGSPWTHTFNSAESVTIGVTLRDSAGESDSSTSTETIDADPEVSVSVNESVADVGIPIDFTATATDGTGGYTYSWTLNENQISTASSFGYSFSSAGSYTISVTVHDSFGASALNSTEVTINPLPHASLTAVSQPIEKGQEDSFTATETDGSGTAAFTWSWTVNGTVEGGGVGSSSSFEYTFNSAGQFWVNSTVTDSDGQHYTAAFYLYVQRGPLTGKTTAPTVNLDPEVTETFNVTAENGTAPYTYSWLVNGTGQGATSRTFTYTVGGPGAYNVTCIITDHFGAHYSATVNVTVNPYPKATIVSGPTIRDVGVNGTWRGGVSGGTGPFTFLWSGSDGAHGNASTWTHAFAASGIYSVEVTITDTFGNDATAETNVTVNPDPSLSVNSGSVPIVSITHEFTATVSGGSAPVSLLWTFPGGVHLAGDSVNESFTSGGTVAYTIAVSDGGGYSANDSFNLRVQLYVATSATTVSAFAPLTTTFSSSVLGASDYAYNWTFGDGDSSVALSPTETFAVGNWTVELVVTASNGAVGFSNLTIRSLPAPVAVAYTPSSGITVLTSVRFAVTPNWEVTGNWSAYWTFPGGTQLEGGSVSWTFPTYRANAAVELRFAYSKTWYDNLTVPMVPATPTVNATGIPVEVPPGTVLALDASDSSAPDANITAYTWTWEGRGYNGAFVYLLANETGNLTLQLTITDSLGAHASESWSILVVVSGTDPAIAIALQQTANGTTLGFTLNVTAPAGIKTVDVFFDGQLLPLHETGSNATYAAFTFSIDQSNYQGGEYALEVVAYDRAGDSNSRDLTVTVSSSGVGAWGWLTDFIDALGGTGNFLEFVGLIVGILSVVIAVYALAKRKGTAIVNLPDGYALQGKPGGTVALVRKKGGR